nr:Chain B, DNA-directed RNA polymerase subunit beta' [Xanthomonas oryzae pv. oryzae KACC 10331]
MKDLLNLFNQ